MNHTDEINADNTTVFECARCRMTKTHTDSMATGYGLNRRRQKICFACCAIVDRDAMIKHGRSTLYLDTRTRTVTNWPGTLTIPLTTIRTGRHNMAGTRYDVYFQGPDRTPWHGVTYGDNTQLCHCRQLRRKSQNNP